MRKIGGLAFLILGLYITYIQIKTFKSGKQDQLGFDIKLLGGGIMAIILGLALIFS
jgi:hypothetical protein